MTWRKTSVTLVMYNQSEVKPFSKKRSRVVNPKNRKKYSIEFLIVKGTCKSILGLRATEHPQLLTINKQNILAMDCHVVGSFYKGGLPVSVQRDVFRGGNTERRTPFGD